MQKVTQRELATHNATKDCLTGCNICDYLEDSYNDYLVVASTAFAGQERDCFD